MNDAPYQIHYEFHLNGETVEHFDIQLDPQTLLLLSSNLENLPEWTQLEHKQCSICTLNNKIVSHCPVAVNISTIISVFKNFISHEECTVHCITPERTYLKKTSVVEGLSSILGIVMATSNCPVMEIFKPMARFHLPFSTLEETIVRTTSMYLLRQYFEYNSNRSPDLKLDKLQAHYNNVRLLNEGIYDRIKDLHKNDSDKNAIVVFHSLSDLLTMEIDTNLQLIAYLFSCS